MFKYTLAATLDEMDREGITVAECPLRSMRCLSLQNGRIVGINQLSREIVAGKVSVEEAYARLHEIVSIPYTHPIRLDLACAVGSACFSYLFGGTVFVHLRLCFAGVPKRHR